MLRAYEFAASGVLRVFVANCCLLLAAKHVFTSKMSAALLRDSGGIQKSVCRFEQSFQLGVFCIWDQRFIHSLDYRFVVSHFVIDVSLVEFRAR